MTENRNSLKKGSYFFWIKLYEKIASSVGCDYIAKLKYPLEFVSDDDRC